MFNMSKFSKALERAGLSREQAETAGKILAEMLEDQLVTRADLRELRVASERNTLELRIGTQRDIKELDRSLILVERRLALKLGVMTGISTAILSLVLLLKA